MNAPTAVSEVIDGEAVIMNLESGHYFSARGVGGVVWEWTIAGHSLDEMAAVVAATWRVETARDDVLAFLNQAQAHALVVPDHDAPTPTAAPLPGEMGGRTYAAPTLEVFTDMEDLLLLDPIHDVSESGWPAPLEAATNDALA